MIKGAGKFTFLLVLLFLIIPFVFAGSVDNEIQKIAHYSEQYETGNINYVQLMVYLSSVRNNLNQELGAVSKNEGGLLKQDQIKNVLGKPEEETKWVWVEGEERETKLDEPVPVWRRIVFDGKKIRIMMNAHPSIFKKCEGEYGKYGGNLRKYKEDYKAKHETDFGDLPEEEKTKIVEEFNQKSETDCEKFLVYRLNFQTEFKKPAEQLDILGKINDIKLLAEDYNADSSKTNAEILAKESVNAEKLFESYFKRNPGNCEDIMKELFGAENQRDLQKMMVNEVDFYSGENFEAIMRIEMCDDCEWNWVNLNMWIEGRGKGFEQPKDMGEDFGSKEMYQRFSQEEFKTKTGELIEEIKKYLGEENYKSAYSSSSKLRIMTDAWNEKSNNVWEQVDKDFVSREKSMTEEERQKYWNNYGWIKDEQEKRKLEKELRKNNFEERKNFYNTLFAGFDKKEFYFEQVEFEKRLIENFMEQGEEICNNFEDDNKDGKSDCGDEQCGGKICGKTEMEIVVDNGTIKEERNLYCISGYCQLKEEKEEIKEAVCGDHVCEGNESIVSCVEDCSACQKYDALECSGTVVFGGEDANGCPLEPICVEEDKSCNMTEDCTQPLCGIAECIEGMCQTTGLAECREPDCIDGEEKIQNCEDGSKVVSEICESGLWTETEYKCEDGIIKRNVSQPDEREESGSGSECLVREDCGGENDVCSNGWCVTIPQAVITEPELEEPEFVGENIEVVQEETSELIVEEETEKVTEESGEVTGNFIFNFFRTIAGGITGKVVDEGNAEDSPPLESQSESGFEGSTPTETSPSESSSDNCPDAGSPPEVQNNCWYEKRVDDKGCVSGYDVKCNEGDQKDNEFRNDQDEENREKKNEGPSKEDCDQRCGRECNDRLIKPCTEKCIRDSGCLNEDSCDGKIEECETQCKTEKDISSCVTECNEKCLKGENTWENPEWEKSKEQMGVFSAGGSCRTNSEQGKGTEGHIWLNGWGKPFDDIQQLKQKYYMGGDAEWCKWDLENLQKERKEIENGFNQEFIEWFFDKYMTNNAEDWEQQTSGMFEMYWRVVENQMQTIQRMQCMGVKELQEYNLINFSYETEYGSIEYWEELKEMDSEDVNWGGPIKEKTGEKIKVISPYMKVWIFPPKEFIKFEMQKSMKNHEFPGPSEEKMERENEEGPTEEEKAMIKQDKEIMSTIRAIAGKYEGNLKVDVSFVDLETGEVVFNIFAQINEEDILKMKPSLPEETEEDVTIKVDFEKVYELIMIGEKDMGGERIEYPPWEKQQFRPIGKVKEIANGVKMFFKVRSIINSAEISPESAKEDVDKIFGTFFKTMLKGGPGDGEQQEESGEKIEQENSEIKN
ncbi:MAG: hypothetical protein AABX88_00775 [Nanoarchaeota archaeon]